MTAQFQIRTLLPAAALVGMLFLLPACAKGDASGAQPLEKAKQLIEQGNYEEAFMQLNQALAQAPRDPDVHLNLGWLYLYTDDPAHAARELQRLDELAPDRGETYHLKGAVLSYNAQQVEKTDPAAARKLHEAAAAKFMEALKRDEKSDQLYFDLATSLIALERYEEALRALDSGFEHIPARDLESQVNFQIASCTAHSKLGLYEEAIADCRQAREFTHNPESRQRIEDMVESMRLMNPKAKAAVQEAEAEEKAIIDTAVAD